MKAYSEISLTSFEFWAGAKVNAEILTYEEIEQIEKVLEYIYEQIEDITINNLFLFEFGWVYEYIGIKYNEEEDKIIRRRIKRRRIK